ncbi:MAG: hypothetical protein HYZ71_14005 [Deltaproteobacteria bacterium]|nr:hypothetical protein [Deltaproteobacteria bacterium]
MKSAMMALVLLVGLTANAASSNASLLDLEKAAAQIEAATCSQASDTGAHGGWVCYARDACGKTRSGCGICRDHAEAKAIAQCEATTRDAGTCYISYCERE